MKELVNQTVATILAVIGYASTNDVPPNVVHKLQDVVSDAFAVAAEDALRRAAKSRMRAALPRTTGARL